MAAAAIWFRNRSPPAAGKDIAITLRVDGARRGVDLAL